VSGSTPVNCQIVNNSSATETSDITLNSDIIYTVISYPSGIFSLTLNVIIINVNGECYFQSLDV
jgi:hypothetical protein